jgi:hypothetical protein
MDIYLMNTLQGELLIKSNSADIIMVFKHNL